MATKNLRFYTSESLGPTQHLTPDGFLLCENVPLARTGVLLYADGEVPVEADQDGIIRVLREPEEVFSPSAIASFNGKPVTNDHPPEKVSPGNWRTHAVGVVINPRRGDGRQFDDDFLYADLLITDEDAIQDIRDGKREVSAGYDADYEQVRPGEGRQHQIVGNHVALVDKGRCGPRCAIGDQAMAKKVPAWFDRVLKAHTTGDSSGLVMELEKIGDMLGDVLMGDEKTVDTTADATKDDGNKESEILQRLEALERAVAVLAHGEESESKDKKKTKDGATKDEDKEEDEEEKEDKEEKREESKDAKTADEDEEDKEEKEDKEEAKEDRKESKDRSTKDRRAAVGDSTSLRGPWQELVSRAEFLAPGIKIPTFDAAAPARTTFDAMCQFRRKVLGEAMKEDDTASAVEQIAGGKKPNLTQMTCDAVALLFNGASELMRQQNTKRSTDRQGVHNAQTVHDLSETVKLINQRNRERYGVRA